MAVKDIRVFPDPVLRQKAKLVPVIDDSVRQLIRDMVDTMKAAPGVGLAAPQVGASLRIIVVDAPEKGIVVLVNPQIVRRGGEQVCNEGCLSVPGYRAEVTRSDWVRAKGLDAEGKEVRIKGHGFLAQILEHEIDHLNGVLYIDLLESKDQLVPVMEADAAADAAANAGPGVAVR